MSAPVRSRLKPAPIRATLDRSALPVLEASSDAVWASDARRTITFWSRGAAAFYGYPARQVMGRRVDDVLRSVWPVSERTRAKALAERGAWHGEVQHRARDGRVVTVESRLSRLKAQRGAVILAVDRDVTQRRLADRLLRDARQFHQQVIDGVADGIAVYDRNLRYQIFNGPMERITGLRAADVVGAHPAEVLPHFASNPLSDILQRALAGERVVRDDVPWGREGDASPRWIADEHAPFRAPDGSIIGVIATMRDVTERKGALERELAMHERTRRIMQATGLGMWEIDIATQRMTWSENLGAVFGWPMERDVGTNGGGFQYIHSEDRQRAHDVVDEALVSKTGFSHEFRAVPQAGGVRWLRSVSTITGAEGTTPALVGIVTDITRQRSLEAQLRQAQKMEAIGKLAGGVAHDFNNLLTAILGYSRFLAESLTDEAQRRDVEQILKAAQRATGLTKQLLAFSRQQVLEARPLDVNAVITDHVQMLQRLIGEHIQLVTELTSEPVIVMADSTQLGQVLMNLAVNARDAMPNGGRLRIQTGRTHVTGEGDTAGRPLKPGRYARVSVIDEGTGMTDEVRAQLFEPFFTTKPSGHGTGLGLATVYGIVSQSGGDIMVETELGRGSIFTVHLPLAVSGLDGPAAAVPTPRRGTERVLLVEDEEAVRMLAQMILQQAGYRVAAAATPAEAERVFDAARGDFDVLVSDVIMPGGTGPALFTVLRARKPTLKVLYMSGYTDNVTLGDSGSARNFVQKPFAADDLTRRLYEVLHVDGG